jgi:adenine-specific DNA-methyltransferase
MAKKAKAAKKVAVKAKTKPSIKTKAKPIVQYEHLDKERVNNPHIGLVNESTDTEYGQNKKTYQYDPHLDPQLQWAGKAETLSIEVPIVNLHVHERIDPKTIIDCVRKSDDDKQQLSLFEKEKRPLREAVEFYKHKEGWSNRLIAGDSLLVMNSLLQKEAMAGKIQMVYVDPPYGIDYKSNFQPFTNKKEVVDGNDDDLTQEPEMIKAFRDTWELGIHSYLNYLRDRFKLIHDLLHTSGSIFVQIGDENVHRVSLLLDEVFGSENRIATISYATTSGSSTNKLPLVCDYILWYSKKKEQSKFRQLYESLTRSEIIDFFSSYVMVELPNGECRKPTDLERLNPNVHLPKGSRIYRRTGLDSQGSSTTGRSEAYTWKGKSFPCPTGRHWSISFKGMDRLAQLGRLDAAEGDGSLMWKKYENEVPGRRINNLWPSQMYEPNKEYVVQTATLPIQRCMLMVTDPGDLVLDITCGSGTTAHVAEQWGRRWITCDSSRVALALAKKRLMTTQFDYYQLAFPSEGISGGFEYKNVSKVTPKTLGGDEPPAFISLFDQPIMEPSKNRITGPFTVESIPAPFVSSLDIEEQNQTDADTSISRSGETLRQNQWRDELQRTGVRAKGGAILHFNRIEAQEGTRYVQAVGETKEAKAQKVLIVFGPEHAPLDARVVELAIDEARQLKPNILLFCAFQFDEEAAKDIDETSEKLIGFKLLKAQMNMDLQTDDLKKQRNANQSFWLIGQPDVRVHEIKSGTEKDKVKVEVAGFDYYDPRTGAIESGGSKNIAMWMLDTDYDGRSLFPRQIFFPMAGPKDGWARLAKNLKAEIDEDKIEAFRGTISLPFTPGKQIAVKIIDDRGIESLKIIKR